MCLCLVKQKVCFWHWIEIACKKLQFSNGKSWIFSRLNDTSIVNSIRLRIYWRNSRRRPKNGTQLWLVTKMDAGWMIFTSSSVPLRLELFLVLVLRSRYIHLTIPSPTSDHHPIEILSPKKHSLNNWFLFRGKHFEWLLWTKSKVFFN